MRIERLDLIRYGRFTDYGLDFGDRSDGPDLHILYGPNEAGKSTLFSAWLDLLFKIPAKTPYGFRHPANQLAIGARLDLGDQVQEIVRTTQTQGALQDRHGNPLPETVLGAALGGFGRHDYTRSFSLDDATLEDGGEAILKSEGELGKLLFSTSAGLASVADILEQAAAEADAIHKVRSQTSEIARLKKERDALLAERKSLDTGAADYDRLVKAARLAAEAYSTAEAALARAQAEHKATGRIAAALPGWAAIQRLRTQLDPLRPVPAYPADWARELIALERQRGETVADLRETRRLLDQLDQALAEIAVDPGLLGQATAIDRVLENQDRFTTALRDLPAREREQAVERATIADIRHRIAAPEGVTDRALIFPTPVTGRLRDLIERRSGVQSALQAARREQEEAATRLAEAQAECAALPPTPDVAALDRVRSTVTEALETLALPDLERRTAAARRRLADEMAALAPWTGTEAALAALPVPSADRLAALKAALAGAHEAVRAGAERLAEAVADAEAADAAVTDARTDAAGVDDETFARARADRDRRWTEHRAVITAVTAGKADAPGVLEPSAAAFEAALKADDQVTTGRAQAVQAVEAHRLAVRAATEAARRLAAQRRRAAAAAKALETEQAAFASVLGGLNVPADWLPDTLTDWLGRRTAALARRDELADLETRLTEGRDRVAVLEATLRQALAPVAEAAAVSIPDQAKLTDLRALAERLCTEARTTVGARAAARKREQEAKRDLTRRQTALTEADAELRAWSEAWRAALAETWLGAAARGADPAEMRELLGELDRLQPVLQQERSLTQRIEKMRKDRAAFAQQVCDLFAGLAADGTTLAAAPVSLPLDPADDDAVRAAADWLRGLLDQSRRSAHSREQKLAERTAALAELERIEARLARLDARRAEMERHFGVETPEALREAMERADEKRRLERDLEQRVDELLKTLTVPALSEAEAQMAAALADDHGGDALRARLDAQEGALAQLTEQARMAWSDKVEAERSLTAVGGDDAVTRLEERLKALDLQTEDAVDRYLRLKVGTLAAEEALRRYRDRHRSEMMALAGRAFRTITGGRFSGLTTANQATGKGRAGEVVLARRADGGTLNAQDMSKGTRFQLYLALRIAGYLQMARMRGGTLPFIADDILETADDERSGHALTMLAEMAETGQVIYLTHHRHLVEQARAVAGDAVRVHELPAPPTPRVTTSPSPEIQ